MGWTTVIIDASIASFEPIWCAMNYPDFEFPPRGCSATEVTQQLRVIQPDATRGHWCRVFRGPADVQEVGRTVYNMFLSDNGLFSLRTDYIRRVEDELVGMCLGLFHSPEGAAGTFTSGGSESVYSALHAMREWAREERPQIRSPEVIVPYSAHPSFSKGCHYFGLKLVRTPLATSRRADVTAMADAVTGHTIGIVGSAPCWPYGLYDPIEEIGALAARHGLWMHVDACVGGYLAPFVEQLGHALPVWDFRIVAVKSISADLHKYGYCPKPASTVLWRSEDLKRFHHVHPGDWPGGSYRTQGMAGSRSVGPMFAAWAVIKYLGADGYLKLAKQVLAAKAQLTAGIRDIDGLFVLESDLLPLGFGSHTLDMQLIAGELQRNGWILFATREPPLINLPIDAATDSTVSDPFLADLRAAAMRARAGGSASGKELEY
jgi:sphinganine-1-phosphate aldolase